MGYYDRDERYSAQAETEGGWGGSALNQFTAIFVRLIGVVLLMVGLWVSIKVIVEAWDLYRMPAHIERFAVAIEKGSNLDKSIASLTATRPAPAAEKEASGSGDLERHRTARPREAEVSDYQGPRLSYFLAWVIGILLLMLIGRLALAAVKTGGELALYDTQVKKFARTLIRELGETTPSALEEGGRGTAARKF